MSLTLTAPAPRVESARPRVRLSTIYVSLLAVWLVTRLLVLVHQGAWPWMNAFVVAAARGIVVGDWAEAVRPQLPAVLGVPLVLAGLTEQQAVAVLYLLASVVQFAAFVTFLRAAFPDQQLEQSLGLLFFSVVPYDHSIHHYRDVPVVLASSAVFLLAAHWVRAARRGVLSGLDVLFAVGAALLGVWSRTEVLTFMGALIVLALCVWRARALRLAGLYLVAGAVAIGSLLLAYRLEGLNQAEAARYQWHTFLDSTPESWLTPECRTAPTENCRERDGLMYFGPAEPQGGVLPMVVGHPVRTLAKTAQSAWDNLWIVLGPNVSTFPGIVPLAVVLVAFVGACRAQLVRVPGSVGMVAAAVVAETVLPPLSWAPPHPQYHLQMVLAVMVVVVPLLIGLSSIPRARLAVWLFFAANAVLSAFRYTRYPGY